MRDQLRPPACDALTARSSSFSASATLASEGFD